MNKRNIWIIVVIVLTALSALLLGNLIAERAQRGRNLKDLSGLFSFGNSSKVSDLLSLIDGQYVDSVDLDSITDEVMSDIVSKLDPHSVYIPAKDLEAVNSELEGSFSGIGVQFNIQSDTVMIVSVISGGPSEKVGLMAGDRIVKVNDTAFVGK